MTRRLPGRGLARQGGDESKSSPVGMTLRPYQIEAADALRAGLKGGFRRMLVQLATGLGKTILFGDIAHKAVARGRRVLVIAHTSELIRQAREKMLVLDPSAAIGIVQSSSDEADAPIVIASIQTLARPSRLERAGRFDVIIIDEAHHAAARNYRKVLERLGAFEPKGPVVIGVTATPSRADGVGLDAIFQKVVYEMGILDGIRDGHLSDIRAIRIGLDTDFSGVRARAGDFARDELGDLLLAADTPRHVVAAYLRHARGRRTIVFTPTVAMAKIMAEAFGLAGVRAAAVSGDTSPSEQAATLDALRRGDIDVVVNAMLLTEGFDCPAVDCIIIARPTKSKTLYTQMIGRGTRLHPGKRDCLILDVVGRPGRLDLVTAASLFGVAPSELARRPLSEVVTQLAPQEAATAGGELVSVPVELFRRRPLNWVRVFDGSYALAVKHGRVQLAATSRGWTATVHRNGEPTETIGRDLPLDLAQAMAEDRARQLGGDVLADPNAPWRRRPVSRDQIAHLRLRGIDPVPQGMTRGEASDLMAALPPVRWPGRYTP